MLCASGRLSCVGAVDGRHAARRGPPLSRHQHRRRGGAAVRRTSIVLQSFTNARSQLGLDPAGGEARCTPLHLGEHGMPCRTCVSFCSDVLSVVLAGGGL